MPRQWDLLKICPLGTNESVGLWTLPELRARGSLPCRSPVQEKAMTLQDPRARESCSTARAELGRKCILKEPRVRANHAAAGEPGEVHSAGSSTGETADWRYWPRLAGECTKGARVKSHSPAQHFGCVMSIMSSGQS